MKEFDYTLDYKNILFEKNDPRYRIGRGEQGVLLVRPYTNDICQHWRFKTIQEARVSSHRIYGMYVEYKEKGDFPLKLKTKDEERTFIEADEEFRAKKTEVEYYETVVEYLQEVIKQVGQRNFQIKNAIEWRKFEAGI